MAEPTIYDERKVVLQNVLSAQRLFCKHIRDEALQRQASKHLEAVRDLYLKHAPVRGRTVASPPASTDTNNNTGQVAQADIDLNESYEWALPQLDLPDSDDAIDSNLPDSDDAIDSKSDLERSIDLQKSYSDPRKNVTHFRVCDRISKDTSAGTSGMGKGGKGSNVKGTIVKKTKVKGKRKEKWDLYDYSSSSRDAKTAELCDDSDAYSLADLDYSADNLDE